jgi:hypothetical protein
MAYVYKHFRKDTNEVFYIGIGKTKRRVNSSGCRNQHWKNIVNKVGFYYEIVEDNLSWQQACEVERQLIKEYGRRDLGTGSLVNMTDGGDGNYNFSEEVLEKIRNASKNRVVSDETRLKLSKLNKGKIVSDETKSKLKGRIVSKETRDKLSKANKKCVPPSRKGVKLSEETKKLLSEKNKGRKLSEETCKKIAFASANRSDEAKQNKSDGLKRWWKARKAQSVKV